MVPATCPHLPLFVYGTLLPGEVNYPAYLKDRTANEQPATVQGSLWLVEDEDYPYLLGGPGAVYGMLIDLIPWAYTATLAAIDRLEDFDPQVPKTSLYLRRRVKVWLSDGQTTNAWGYFWNAATRPGIRLAHGDFRRRDPGGRGARQPAEH